MNKENCNHEATLTCTSMEREMYSIEKYLQRGECKHCPLVVFGFIIEEESLHVVSETESKPDTNTLEDQMPLTLSTL